MKGEIEMRKITFALLVFILTLSISLSALAAPSFSPSPASIPLTVESNSDNESRLYFDDGSYLITVIEEGDDALVSPASVSQTKTGSKTSTYYNSDNKALWYVKVTGTFSYGNGSSKCTSASVTAASNDSNWKISDKSASKSKNAATAEATAKRYVLNITVQTITKSVTLTCSSTGKLS